jgi:hypothetical protein
MDVTAPMEKLVVPYEDMDSWRKFADEIRARAAGMHDPASRIELYVLAARCDRLVECLKELSSDLGRSPGEGPATKESRGH